MKIYCSSLNSTTPYLEYGQAYQCIAADRETVTVVLETGAEKRLPQCHFSRKVPPKLLSWTSDDEIRTPRCDYIEVTCTFERGKRWYSFTTPSYLALQIPRSGDDYWSIPHMIVVMELSSQTIESTLLQMLHEGILWEVGCPLKGPRSNGQLRFKPKTQLID